jgi:hypothetical protein
MDFIMVLVMKPSPSTLYRAMTLSLLAAGLSSCSLFRNGKYASQWEIQSDVPASLSNGQAAVPTESPMMARQANSNLSGLDPLASPDGGTLDLPMTENLPMTESGTLIDIPKPHLAMTGNPYRMSPPELLSIPQGTAGTELSPPVESPDNITTLLPGPPPLVTEEELAVAPRALPIVSDTAETAAPAPSVLPALEMPAAPAPAPAVAAPEAPLPRPVQYAAAAPSIPFLYGRLDLTPFLSFALDAPLTKTN